MMTDLPAAAARPTPSNTDDNIVSGVRRADLQPLPLLSYARGRGTGLDASQLIRYLAEAGCPLTFPDEKALPYAGPSSWARFDPTDSDGSGLTVAPARATVRACQGQTQWRTSASPWPAATCAP